LRELVVLSEFTGSMKEGHVEQEKHKGLKSTQRATLGMFRPRKIWGTLILFKEFMIKWELRIDLV